VNIDKKNSRNYEKKFERRKKEHDKRERSRMVL
jgi:hypothetical protein